MFTFFFVTLFRSFDTKNDYDAAEDNNKLSQWNESFEVIKQLKLYIKNRVVGKKFFLKKVSDLNKPFKQTSIYTICELEAAKKKQMKINQCQKILREILFTLMLLWALFMVTYSNRNQNTFSYQNHINNTFIGYQHVK